MRNFLILFLLCLTLGCDTESAPDCLQRTGNLVQKEISVNNFERILVMPNVELVISQAEETKVTVETGENLLNDISVSVQGDRLILEDTNNCNLVREFNQTIIYVSTPNLTEIRHESQFQVRSEGVIRFPSLRLISEDFTENNGGNTTGIFDLSIDVNELTVINNNISSYFIKGNVNSLTVNFFSGLGRFDGSELIANQVNFFHRGSNKIIVNPVESLTGEIRSTGDVIALNRPEIVEVEEFFIGKLIFQ